jgi:hypothetical protein
MTVAQNTQNRFNNHSFGILWSQATIFLSFDNLRSQAMIFNTSIQMYCIPFDDTFPPPRFIHVGVLQPDIRLLSAQHWTGGTGDATPFKLYEITAYVA